MGPPRDLLFTLLWLLVAGAVLLLLLRWNYATTATGRLRRALARGARGPRRVVRAARRALGRRERRLDAEMGRFVEAQRRERLRAVPVEELREAGASRVRWGALREAGVRSLADVLERSPAGLAALEGVGETSAGRVVAAARKVAEGLAGKAPELPGPELVEPRALDAARAALALHEARAALGPAWRRAEAELAPLLARAALLSSQASFARWLLDALRPRRVELLRSEGRAAAAELERWRADQALAFLRRAVRALPPEPDPPLAPEAVRRRAREAWAELAALLEASLVRLGWDEARSGARARGGLPVEIAARVAVHPLEVARLGAELRGYQRFGAQYLLAQRRTILGDEMGLGKTVEALAAMVHLWAERERRLFLVVAPAGLIWNWVREAERRAPFPALAVHGEDAPAALARWHAEGGMAVTSYATLRNLVQERELVPPGRALDLLVADEAHYLKNPTARRTQATALLIERAERVALLTGTPQRNHPREFLHLVRLVRPEVAGRLLDAGDFHQDAPALLRALSGEFHRHVASVYLRRNQEDVLHELPERLESEEWVELSPDERAAYRSAVLRGDFMGLRRATTLGAEPSAKLERLAELLEDHRESGRKVLIFSTFLAVLDAVATRFAALGRLQGSTRPEDRLALADRFAAAPGHALLACQIDAAGLGLNLQAASVVVLLEPQLEPTAEDQAIARAHRMGQTQRVLVHRLLARDTVDERVVQLLATKRELFAAYAEESAVKTASPEATRTLPSLLLAEERARAQRLG